METLGEGNEDETLKEIQKILYSTEVSQLALFCIPFTPPSSTSFLSGCLPHTNILPHRHLSPSIHLSSNRYLHPHRKASRCLKQSRFWTKKKLSKSRSRSSCSSSHVQHYPLTHLHTHLPSTPPLFAVSPLFKRRPPI
jgi:hypothetical protein